MTTDCEFHWGPREASYQLGISAGGKCAVYSRFGPLRMLLMTLVTINKTIMVGYPNNDIAYIKTTPLTWNNYHLLVQDIRWKTANLYLLTFFIVAETT